MTELTDRILNLTGEAVLVIRNGSICRANFRAAELLGGDCVGKRSADYFGDVLGQIQSPLFLAQLSVNGTPLLLRCSTQPDGKLLFLSPVPQIRELLDRSMLRSMTHQLSTQSLNLENLRLRLEDRSDRETLALLRSATAQHFAQLRIVNNAGILLQYENGLEDENLYRLAPGPLFQSMLAGLQDLRPELKLIGELDCPVRIPCIPALLKSLFSNLVSNAILHGEGDRVSLRLSEMPKHLLLSVSDSGRGIPEAELPMVFERFRHLTDPGRAQSGPGFGLSVCRRIARLHNGALLLESREGQGTQVTVSLSKDIKGADLHQADRECEVSARDLLIGFAGCLPEDCFSELYLD